MTDDSLRPSQIECPECNGSGDFGVIDGVIVACEECDGSGYVPRCPSCSSLLAEKGRLEEALQEARERIRKIEQLARLEEMERVLDGLLSPASDIQRGLQLLEAIAVLRIDKKRAEAARDAALRALQEGRKD